jgi:2-amino-4,5-dihydroxy-6-oxo-7-(phosphooxy)heptanoate synthase
VQETLLGGARGVAMGRNIFTARDPGAMARRIADVVHGPLAATTAVSRQRLVAAG